MGEKKEKILDLSGRLLARNALLNFIGQATPLVVGVITIPFIVRGLGTERFGLLSLAWVVLGYFSVFDLGLGRATTKFVAEALGKGEADQVPRLVWTAVTVQAVLGIVGALVLTGITPLLVERILKVPSDLFGEAKATFRLLALSIPVVLISGSFRGVLEASQRFDLVNAVSIPISVLTYILPLVGLLFGMNLPGIVVLILLARAGALTAFVALDVHTIPRLRRYSGSLSFFPRLFSFGGWVMVSGIVSPVLSYLDRFFIGSFLTMSAVTYYTVPFDLMTRLWIIPTSLVMTLFPAFSSLGAMRKEDERNLFIRSVKYLLLTSGLIVLVLMVFADDALRLWLGADFARQSTIVLRILLLGALIGLVAPISGALLQGLGRPDVLGKLYLMEIPLNIVLMWFLVRYLGIIGVSWLFTFRALIETTVLFLISAKLIRLPYRCIVKSKLWLSVLLLLGVGGLLWAISLIEVVGFRIGLTVIVVLIFAIVSWRYVLDEIDKKVITSLAPNFLSHKRNKEGKNVEG
jgi:O-antigen/teichoic acid export membrane protein